MRGPGLRNRTRFFGGGFASPAAVVVPVVPDGAIVDRNGALIVDRDGVVIVERAA